MKRLILWGLAVGAAGPSLHAQELFVFTEPASNMATRSIGLRLDNTIYNDGAYRLSPEIMWGASRRWMIHVAGYASDMDRRFGPEGGSFYAKYRVYAHDEVHEHFRVALFGKVSGESHRSVYKDEIDLNGSNSGYQAGIVATQLLHKLALSGSAAYTQRWDGGPTSRAALNYTASAGLLLLPRHYTGYGQTNVNLMCEFLGATALDKPAAYLDVGPAVQFIFHSIARLDVGYRTQIAGGMQRWATGGLFIRLEYNILNAYR
jgi:hypothetical protein